MKRTRKVLIQEPDPDIRDLYQAIFQRQGVKCRFVRDPEEVSTALASERFCLAIVDHSGPRESGLELVAQINRAFPDQPVLLVSTVPLTDTKINDLIKRGINFFLPKPFDINLLRGILEQADVRESRPVFPKFQPGTIAFAM